jgi:hypothetical protein
MLGWTDGPLIKLKILRLDDDMHAHNYFLLNYDIWRHTVTKLEPVYLVELADIFCFRFGELVESAGE